MYKKFIISGGGTGGHIFPAIAIANELKRIDPHSDILFIGAKGRMEMQKVPEAGYKIKGLWISGLQRKISYKNLLLPVKWVYSVYASLRIIKTYKPDVVVGVGGYASAAIVFAASIKGIPILLQEQNSFAGLTNKWLSKKANKICVAYPEMEKFFPSHKIVYTGNPIRQDLIEKAIDKKEAKHRLGLDTSKPLLFVTGGSLGAKMLNESVVKNLELLKENNIQLLWQTGSFYFNQYKTMGGEAVLVQEFVKNMDLVYSAADLILCRAGALTISEICALGKASVLVPSPYVAEDHQTHNALSLANRDAAILIKDQNAIQEAVPKCVELLCNMEQREKLGRNALALGRPNAAHEIASEIIKLVKS
jgi:UDP-N-acetylglucosamine--N-acetylmuramyl-(pentapeptide) pyrophosphoryl-undecaprenol N-acetylglucosamine transferase